MNAVTGSYTVRVKFNDCDHFPNWIATDEKGDQRTKGYHPDMHKLSGRELVEYLYHAEEVLKAWVDTDGVTWAEIAEYGPQPA